MQSKMTSLQLFICVCLLAVLGLACPPTGGSGEPQQKLFVGDSAPAFTLADRDGNQHSRQAAYADKPLLLVFFSAYCPPCRMEMKMLSNLKKFYAGRADGQEMKYNVLLVTGSSMDEIRELEGDQGDIVFPVVYDEGYVVSKEYGIFTVPYNFLIGTDGQILMVEIGYGERMFNQINGIIEGQS